MCFNPIYGGGIMYQQTRYDLYPTLHFPRPCIERAHNDRPSSDKLPTG